MPLLILQQNTSDMLTILSNPDLALVERQIIMTYNDRNPSLYTHCRALLDLRKTLINSNVLSRQEEILPDIIAFNDALCNALKEMYDRAHRIWAEIKDKDSFGDSIELRAKCFLGYDYPELHPVQGDDRQELWDAICDSGWNPLYEDGVTISTLTLPRDSGDSFDSLTGMDCLPPNWNEGLDLELTKDLHLISPFHHLLDHTKFAITDFLYVRKFETEINIEIDRQI